MPASAPVPPPMISFVFIDLTPPLTRFFSFFFFNDTATTEIYTLSLHDALPISRASAMRGAIARATMSVVPPAANGTIRRTDRKSTRLNSSHLVISYAVFCLKKKKKQNRHHIL